MIQAGPFDFINRTADPIPPTLLDQIANGELVVGCFLIVVATAFYLIGFKWWQRRAGRAILGVLLSISVLLIHITLQRIAGGDYPFRDLIRAGVFLALPVTVVYLIYTLARSFFGGPEEVLKVETTRRGQRLMTGPTPITNAGQPVHEAAKPAPSDEAAPTQ